MGPMTAIGTASTASELQDGPIFVVGSMRSGSTMLRLILDSHPRIAIGPETGFMGALAATKRIPNWKYGAEWYQRLGWSEAELDARLCAFYSGMFARHAAAQGKSRWGEKTPFHTTHMSAMAEVFPSSTFVGIVRHPGAVASSLHKSFHYAFDDALSYWSSTNLDMLRAARSLGTRFALCRYEDLVLEGEPVLRELMHSLGEEFSDNLMQHHVVQRDQGAPRVVDGSTSTRDPIDASRAVRWADDADASDLEALRAVAPLASYFGYSSADATQRDDLTPPSGRAWTLTGDDIAQRCDEWHDRVDFDAHPPTLVIDADPEELAKRLAHVEGALERTRSRRAVRLVDAARKVQRGRSPADLRRAWEILRGQKT
jgi:hypothetical protein